MIDQVLIVILSGMSMGFMAINRPLMGSIMGVLATPAWLWVTTAHELWGMTTVIVAQGIIFLLSAGINLRIAYRESKRIGKDEHQKAKFIG